MGAPSDDQIDEAIAWGLANRWSEARIVRHLATLERMSDEELARVQRFSAFGRGQVVTLDAPLGGFRTVVFGRAAGRSIRSA